MYPSAACIVFLSSCTRSCWVMQSVIVEAHATCVTSRVEKQRNTDSWKAAGQFKPIGGKCQLSTQHRLFRSGTCLKKGSLFLHIQFSDTSKNLELTKGRGLWALQASASLPCALSLSLPRSPLRPCRQPRSSPRWG